MGSTAVHAAFWGVRVGMSSYMPVYPQKSTGLEPRTNFGLWTLDNRAGSTHDEKAFPSVFSFLAAIGGGARKVKHGLFRVQRCLQAYAARNPKSDLSWIRFIFLWRTVCNPNGERGWSLILPCRLRTSTPPVLRPRLPSASLCVLTQSEEDPGTN